MAPIETLPADLEDQGIVTQQGVVQEESSDAVAEGAGRDQSGAKKRGRSPATSVDAPHDALKAAKARSAGGISRDVQPVVSGGKDFQLFAKYGSLYDQKGNEVVLKGINWFGFEYGRYSKEGSQAPVGGVLGGLWQVELVPTLNELAKEHFNLLRVPVDYVFAADVKNYPGSGSIKVDEGLIGPNRVLQGKTTVQAMDWLVDECAKLGMLVLFDMQRIDGGADKERGHDEVPCLWYDSDDDAGAVKWKQANGRKVWTEKDGIEAWKGLLRHYAKAWNVIGADLKNEPHGTAYWGHPDDASPKNWRKAAERMGQAILSDQDLKKFTIWVEGVAGNNCGWGSSLEAATKYPQPIQLPVKDKLVYSVHCYGPDVVNKGKDQKDWSPLWKDAQRFKDSKAQAMQAVWDAEWGQLKDSQDVPLILGEWMGRGEQVSELNKVDVAWTDGFVRYHQEKDRAANKRSSGQDASSSDGNNRWKSNIMWCFNNNCGDTGGLVGTDWKTLKPQKLEWLEKMCPFPAKIQGSSSGLWPLAS